MISVQNVSVDYPGSVRALNSTTLSFAPGAFTVLLGPSGAGKSTLLRTLNGLVLPTKGRVEVAGIGDLASRRRLMLHRRGTGMVFQQHQLIGRSTVLSNVLMGRLGHHGSLRTLLPPSREEKLKALAAIERVHLLDFALRRAGELSGGQQQRVGIARAIVQEPSLILADEPVASLDPASAKHVLGLLHRICKEDGLTAIVSLHQLQFAKDYADRIVALAQGEVVFDGPPSALDEPAVQRIYGTSKPANLASPQPILRTGAYA
jgi:phosphonate transport system ATP-binding protein